VLSSSSVLLMLCLSAGTRLCQCVDRIVLCFSSAACTLHACSLYCLSCACMQVLAVVGLLLKSCMAVAHLPGAILGLC
jgi:hypothetical protein